MKGNLVRAGGFVMAAAVTSAGTAVASAQTVPIWSYFVLANGLLVGALLFEIGRKHAAVTPCDIGGDEGSLARDEAVASPVLEHAAITDHWRHTTDGHDVPILMRLKDNRMSHPGYNHRSSGQPPPSIRLGAVVACASPGSSTLTTSDLRARFLMFLNHPPVAELVTELTNVDDSFAWTAWDSNGRMNLGAVLAGDDHDVAPVAWARLLLPDRAKTQSGRDQRCAELLLYIEPRAGDGTPAPPLDLLTWHDRFDRALAVPEALADFLARDLGLATAGDPPAQAGVWLDTPQAMAELVDVQGFDVLPGATRSTWFTGWAFADPDGQLPADLARTWLTQMCDYTLHLDGYEEALATLSTTHEIPITPSEEPVPRAPSNPKQTRLRSRLASTRSVSLTWAYQTFWWLRKNATVVLLAGALATTMAMTIRTWLSKTSHQQFGIEAVVSNEGTPVFAFAGSMESVDYLRYGTQLTVDCLQPVNPNYLHAHIVEGRYGGRWIDAFDIRTPQGEDLRFLSPGLPDCGPPVPIATTSTPKAG